MDGDENLTKGELAESVIADLFATRTRVGVSEALEAGRRRGVSDQTMRRAAKALGVRVVRNGPNPGFWERE